MLKNVSISISNLKFNRVIEFPYKDTYRNKDLFVSLYLF